MAWSTINSMRPAYAMNMYKAHGATRVLDITAGWGARMVGAMAADIDYIGIDSNQKLKPAYNKIKNAVKKYSKSNVTLNFKKLKLLILANLDTMILFSHLHHMNILNYMKVWKNMMVKWDKQVVV